MLVTNWRVVLKHAWSIRLMALAALLTGLEAAWPYLDWLPISKGLFAMLSAFVSAGAIYARLVAQKPISGDQLNATGDADLNWAEGQAPSTVNNAARVMMQREKPISGDQNEPS